VFGCWPEHATLIVWQPRTLIDAWLDRRHILGRHGRRSTAVFLWDVTTSTIGSVRRRVFHVARRGGQEPRLLVVYHQDHHLAILNLI
jgi:hypothetical protein